MQVQVVYLGMSQDTWLGVGSKCDKDGREASAGGADEQALMQATRTVPRGPQGVDAGHTSGSSYTKARSWGIHSHNFFIHSPVGGHVLVSSFGR